MQKKKRTTYCLEARKKDQVKIEKTVPQESIPLFFFATFIILARIEIQHVLHAKKCSQ